MAHGNGIILVGICMYYVRYSYSPLGCKTPDGARKTEALISYFTVYTPEPDPSGKPEFLEK